MSCTAVKIFSLNVSQFTKHRAIFCTAITPSSRVNPFTLKTDDILVWKHLKFFLAAARVDRLVHTTRPSLNLDIGDAPNIDTIFLSGFKFYPQLFFPLYSA